MELRNANGVIYSGTLEPGDWEPSGFKNGYATRFRFKDKTAKTLGDGSLRDGIFRCSGRFRNVQGEPSFTIQLEVYNDFSSATLANMTTQWYGLADIGVLTADWTPTSKGWMLTRSVYH